MKITRITIKDTNGCARELQEAELIAGKGIAGDMHPLKQGRELSLLDNETARRIRGLPGLCTGRFVPGITFEEESEGMTPGALFAAGTAVIRIMQKGKKCFPECPLSMAGNPCRLAQKAVFAEVTAGGWINIGDSLIYKKG